MTTLQKEYPTLTKNTENNRLTSDTVLRAEPREDRPKPCPVCGARTRQQGMRMQIIEDEIIRWLRENNVTATDSCIFCVEKHVGRALILWEESLSAQDSGTAEGVGRVNTYLNHIKIIGHLGNAYDESADYPELHEVLKKAERQYRYSGTVPPWADILTELKKVKEEMKRPQ